MYTYRYQTFTIYFFGNTHSGSYPHSTVVIDCLTLCEFDVGNAVLLSTTANVYTY